MTAAVPSERVTGNGGVTGVTVWITGLPAAGKSTLAAAVERRLAAAGVPACHLDGDRLRTGLNADLGYDRVSRRENVRRVAEVARLFAHAGTVAIAALISPYESDRVAARVVHEDDCLPMELCRCPNRLSKSDHRPAGPSAGASCVRRLLERSPMISGTVGHTCESKATHEPLRGEVSESWNEPG